MSASIYWKPINPEEGTGISVGAPSRFIESMRKVFGDLPIRLEQSNVEQLTAMAAVGEGTFGKDNPYAELVEALRTHNAVEVWAVW